MPQAVAIPLAAGAVGLGGSLLSASAQKKAGKAAAAAQAEADAQSIAEQRRQFDKIQELLKPYVEAGTTSIGGQQDLLGLSGPGKQQAAIDALRGSPMFESLLAQGEEGILQNAAATGGLRGGNVQDALSRLRPEILIMLIESQYSKLGGLSSLGQASAAGVGAAGQNMANQISALNTATGDARAQAALIGGRASADLYSGIAKGVGGLLGNKTFTDWAF